MIDKAVSDVLARADVWQATLEKLAQDLPQELAATIRNEAQNLATRTVAQAGTELMCSSDFYARRAVEALNSLKALLTNQGQGPSALPPAFCQTAPDHLNLNDDPTHWPTVTLHGYDLDHLDSQGKRFGVSLQNESGQNTPFPESRIGRTTHYQVTLNLGNMGPTLYNNHIAKLIVTFNNAPGTLPEIIVVPWTAVQRTEHPVVGATRYTPPRTGGDGDFDTGSSDATKLIVTASMRLNGMNLESRTYMYARENGGDHTKVEGYSPWTVAYTPPSGWRVVSYRPNGSPRYERDVTTQGSIGIPCSGGEVVDHFTAWVDHGGDEAGTWTELYTYWRILEVTIEQIEPEWLN